MRILHTADWHLGKKLNEEISLIEEQAYILDQIREILKEKIDVFVLAGDIYQHVHASDDAIRLLNDFLEDVVNRYKNTTFILINGNHDPVEKLNFVSSLLKENLKIITRLNKPMPVLIPIVKNHIRFHFYCMPFIRTIDYRKQFSPSIMNMEEWYQKILSSITISKKTKNIFITHAALDFMEREESDSEDNTYGNVELISPDLFSSFDLVLLGHYHKPQKFRERIYYSGSIYKYSKSEYHHTKGVYIHDLQANQTELVPLTPRKEVRFLQGSYKDLIHSENKNDYVFIELDEKYIIPNVKDNLSRYYSHIVSISYKNSDILVSDSDIYLSSEKMRDLRPEILFEKFLEFLYKEKNDTQETFRSRIQKDTEFSFEELKKMYQEEWDMYLKQKK